MKKWQGYRFLGGFLILTLMVVALFGGTHSVQAYKPDLDTNFVCPNSNDPNWWCSPPAHIRVKRMAKQGQPVETIAFSTWLRNTLPNEIACDPNVGEHLSQQLVDATALAVKMYGWARHLKYGHNSPSDDRAIRSYDVNDDGTDGARYVENSATTACDQAIARIGNEMITRNYSGSSHGRIFITEWKRGIYVPITQAMEDSDDMQQRNAEWEIDAGIWSYRNQILDYFYAYFHLHTHN